MTLYAKIVLAALAIGYTCAAAWWLALGVL